MPAIPESPKVHKQWQALAGIAEAGAGQGQTGLTGHAKALAPDKPLGWYPECYLGDPFIWE